MRHQGRVYKAPGCGRQGARDQAMSEDKTSVRPGRKKGRTRKRSAPLPPRGNARESHSRRERTLHGQGDGGQEKRCLQLLCHPWWVTSDNVVDHSGFRRAGEAYGGQPFPKDKTLGRRPQRKSQQKGREEVRVKFPKDINTNENRGRNVKKRTTIHSAETEGRNRKRDTWRNGKVNAEPAEPVLGNNSPFVKRLQL